MAAAPLFGVLASRAIDSLSRSEPKRRRFRRRRPSQGPEASTEIAPSTTVRSELRDWRLARQ
jgi:hypothetical protein